jgi:hypothetical protein
MRIVGGFGTDAFRPVLKTTGWLFALQCSASSMPLMRE